MKFASSIILVIIYLFCVLTSSNGFYSVGHEYQYDIELSVEFGPMKDENDDGWNAFGNLTIQKKDESTLAVWFQPSKVNISSTELLDIHSNASAITSPYLIKLSKAGVVESIVFLADEPIWSANVKRSIAYALQVTTETHDVYGVEEKGLHGNCKTDYFIIKEKDTFNITKIPNLETCTGGIHAERHFNQISPCNDQSHHQNVFVLYEGKYALASDGENYYIEEANIRAMSTINTLESDGEDQYLLSRIHFRKNDGPKPVETYVDLDYDSSVESSLKYIDEPMNCLIQTSDTLVQQGIKYLEQFHMSFLETSIFIFTWDDDNGGLFQFVEFLDEDTLWELLKESNNEDNYVSGKKYSKILLDVIARTGTKASVNVIKRLFELKKKQRSKFASSSELIDIISEMPFYINDPTEDIVKECEFFIHLDNEKYSKTLQDAATLAFSTLVYRSYLHEKITSEKFEHYTKLYYNYYLNSTTYAEKFLYVQTLGNLQLGNVIQYLENIVKDTTQSDDLRSIAMYATMPMVHDHPDQTFQTYWPIFAKKTNSLQLRIVAYAILFTSNPTPGRLMSLHRVMQDEKCQHLVNFYRTSILSMSASTNPCFQKLQKILSYLSQNLPHEPATRFWVSGDYLFDYNDKEYGTMGSIRASLIGDEENDIPLAAYFQIETEVSGRFLNKFGVYVKARGIPDLFHGLEKSDTYEYLAVDKLSNILKAMNLPTYKKQNVNFEFIIESHGKSILSGYYDLDTIQDFNHEELQSKITERLVSKNLEFNQYMFDVKFYSKYKIPTAFGTATNVYLQNTQTTQFEMKVEPAIDDTKVGVKTQSNYRRQTFLTYGSESYNPFVNTLHRIKREQVYMFYIPTNFEMGLTMKGEEVKNFKVTFNQPNDFGIAFKSRTSTRSLGNLEVNGTFDSYSTSDEAYSLMKEYNAELKDLGIKIKFESTDVKEFLEPFEGYPGLVNTYVADDEYLDFWFEVFSKFQFNSVYLGSNKLFEFTVSMDFLSSIEFIFDNYKNETTKEDIYEIIMYQKPEANEDKINYEWKIIHKLSNETENNWKYDYEFYRLDRTEDTNVTIPKDFRFCSTFKIHEVTQTIEYETYFGFNSTLIGCPKDLTRFYFEGQYVTEAIKSENNEDCPHDLVHFDPIPYDDDCTMETLQTYSKFKYFGVKVNYDNVPHVFDDKFDRLSYSVSAWLPDKFELLDLKHGFNFTISAIEEKENSIKFEINDREMTVPDLDDWFDYIPDYDFEEDIDLKFGFTRSCSIIHDRLNTFDETIVSLKDYLPSEDKKDTCSTLLVADCSEHPLFALFLDSFHSKSEETYYGLKVYTGGHYVHLVPQPDHPYLVFVLDNDKCTNLNGTSYRLNKEEGEDDDVTITQDTHGIINIYNDKFDTKVQYNGKNVVSIQAPMMFKHKMCGICNDPYNSEKVPTTFHYCGDDRQSQSCHENTL